MFKKYIGSLGLATLLSLSVLALSSNASATTVDLSEDDPQSGYVVIDDNDKVLFSSNSILEEDNTNPLLRTAHNWANSRWVYYTDHNNYWNGYKWGHSNYYHRYAYHTSTAQVGSSFVRASAGPGQYSVATAKGYGTFYAWYNAPYR